MALLAVRLCDEGLLLNVAVLAVWGVPTRVTMRGVSPLCETGVASGTADDGYGIGGLAKAILATVDGFCCSCC